MKVVSMSDVHLDTFKSFATPTDKVESNSRLENILEVTARGLLYE